MSLLPGQIPPQTVPLGKADKNGNVTISHDYWLFLYNVAAQSITPLTGSDLVALQSSDIDAAEADIAAISRPDQVNDVRLFGRNVGTGGDDTYAINQVLAASAGNGLPTYLAGLTLNSSGGHVHDISLYSVIGGGAKIFFPTMLASATAWQVTATVDGVTNNARHARNVLQGLDLIGTGIGTGLYIAANAEPAAAFVNIREGACVFFGTNILFGNHAYIIKFFGWYSSRAVNFAVNIPVGLVSAAEQIAFFGGGFTDTATGGVAINNFSGNTDLCLYGCSIDGNGIIFINQDHGARTYAYGCHIEILNPTIQGTLIPIQVNGNNTVLSLQGGSLAADGTQPQPWPATILSATAPTITGAGGSLVLLGGGILLNNLRNSTNALCSGSGTVKVVDTITYDPFGNPRYLGLSSNFNLLEDGGFESTAIVDNISIITDVSSIVTVSSASPAVVSWSPHRQAVGQPIAFTSTGTLPVGINAGQTYYVLGGANYTTSTFSFSDTLGGAPIDTSTLDTGTTTCFAVVVSRTQGSNLSLALSTTMPNSGTQCLATTLGAGIGADFIIIVPVKPNSRISATGYYRAATGGEPAFIYGGFTSDLGYSTGVVPQRIGGGIQTGVNIAALPTAWTNFALDPYLVPSWCKFFYIIFNLNGVQNDTFYIDDIVINQVG